MNEMRKAYLSDYWVIYSPKRSARPTDFALSKSREKQRRCVFCSGNEALTPPATLLYISRGDTILKAKDDDGERRSDWAVRCVPNKYPIVGLVGYRSERFNNFPLRRRSGVGFHEVVIESPQHDDHPHRASRKQIELWLNAANDRVRYFAKHKEVASVVMFRNYGKDAGASIAHAHSQIITTPIIPKRIRQEHAAFKLSRKTSGDCALCHVRLREIKSPRRILATPNFSIIAPWASVFPFEFWIIPKIHRVSPVELTDHEVEELADVLQISLTALASLLSDPPYNLVFHMGPAKTHDKLYHWHIKVYPKLSTQAGFELGSGMYINTVMPEVAAEVLRREIS